MTMEVQQITVDGDTATVKLRNLSAEFTPSEGALKVEFYRDSGYTECTLVLIVPTTYVTYWEYATQKLNNFKSYIIQNGHLAGSWNYQSDGGYYRIYDSANETVGLGSKIGEGALPAFT